MVDMKPFERKAFTFYTMILNAYCDEEDMTPAEPKLKLQTGGDLTEDISAMLMAMMLFCEQCSPETVEDMDIIGFTHLLNRVAIQHVFEDAMDKVDVLGE